MITDEKVMQGNNGLSNNGINLGATENNSAGTNHEQMNYSSMESTPMNANATNLTSGNIASSVQQSGESLTTASGMNFGNNGAQSNAPTEEPVRIYPVQLTNFDESQVFTAADSKNTNLNLLMNIPLELSVEIGRTKKKIKDILDMRHGTIVEFDKQANDPVEILVNGQLIAKGNVVVIDDCFGVRVTEIISNEELFDKLT